MRELGRDPRAMRSSGDLRFGYYAVAFLDILGQADAIDQLRSLPSGADEEAARKFVADAKRSLGVTLQTRRFITNYFQSFMATPMPTEVQLLSDRLPKEWNAHRRVSVGIQKFADTVIAYTPLTAGSGLLSMKPVLALLGACAISMVATLAGKAVLRGGVEVGTCVEIENGDIYGPAVVDAYGLEAKVADYPRIVVGPGVLQYISAMKNDVTPGVISSAERDIASLAGRLLHKDHDGQVVFDWLGIDFLNWLGIEVAKKHVGLARDAVPWVIGQQRRFATDEKLLGKYTRLRNYMESRLGRQDETG